MTKGFLRAGTDGEQLVGAEDGSYTGPTASVSADDTWLHINTDSYEGHAMLNIEALPYLIRALRKIVKERKAAGL